MAIAERVLGRFHLPRRERKSLPETTAEQVRERRITAEGKSEQEIRYQVINELTIPNRLYEGEHPLLTKVLVYATRLNQGWNAIAVYPDRSSEQAPIRLGEALLTVDSAEEARKVYGEWIRNSSTVLDQAETGATKTAERIYTETVFLIRKG